MPVKHDRDGNLVRPMAASPGTAVIQGPSNFAGQIPSIAVADMTPPNRKACARIESRMTILSDGRIVSCEQDVMGVIRLDKLGET